MNRRDFLRGALGAAATLTLAPGLWAEAALAAGESDRTLVVLQLAGGNDGLNTVVPIASPVYRQARPTLAVPAAKVLQLADGWGLHPELAPLLPAWQAGELAIVQAVGYPKPNRSHFRAMAIWQSARPDSPAPEEEEGFLARALDQLPATPNVGGALAIGDREPQALRGGPIVPTLDRLDGFSFRTLGPKEDEGQSQRILRQLFAPRRGDTPALAFLRDQARHAYATADAIAAFAEKSSAARVSYPQGGLARELALVAELLGAGLRLPVFYVVTGGFDTHAGQARQHPRLLGELASALAAFRADLSQRGLADRVVLVAWSEFGRRVKENGSGGTDHGSGGPLFALGKPVRGGFVGPQPDLTSLLDGDVRPLTDFRSVYSAVLGRHLGIRPERLLGGNFPPVDLIRA